MRIKSAANGGTLAVGTVTQSYNLKPDGSAALVATVTMPAAPAGDWYVGVDVNPNRDVYEQNMQKNSLWTEDAIEVTLPNLAVGGSTSVSVASGATKGYILADVPAEGIDISEECTYCSHEKYWSHRYTKGKRGGQAAVCDG